MSFFFWQKNIRRVKENRIFFIRIQTNAFFFIRVSKTYLSIIAFSIDDIDRAPRLMDGTSKVSETRFSSRSSSFEIQIVSAIAFPRGTTRFGISDYRYAKITAHHRARGRSVEIAGACDEPKERRRRRRRQKTKKRRALCRRT